MTGLALILAALAAQRVAIAHALTGSWRRALPAAVYRLPRLPE